MTLSPELGPGRHPRMLFSVGTPEALFGSGFGFDLEYAQKGTVHSFLMHVYLSRTNRTM